MISVAMNINMENMSRDELKMMLFGWYVVKQEFSKYNMTFLTK